MGSDVSPARLEGVEVDRLAFLAAVRIWPGDSGDLLCQLPGAPTNSVFPFVVTSVAEVSPRAWRVQAVFSGLRPEAQAALALFLHAETAGDARTAPALSLDGTQPTGPTTNPRPTQATGPTLVPPVRPAEAVRPVAAPAATQNIRLVTADWRARALQVAWPTREVLAGEWQSGLRTGGIRIPSPTPPPPLGMALNVMLSPPDGLSIRTFGSVGAVRDQQVLVQLQLARNDMQRIQNLAGA